MTKLFRLARLARGDTRDQAGQFVTSLRECEFARKHAARVEIHVLLHRAVSAVDSGNYVFESKQ